MKNIKCQACSVFPLHIPHVFPFVFRKGLWKESSETDPLCFFKHTESVCPEAFNFSGHLWCFLSRRGERPPLLAALYPTLLPVRLRSPAAFWLGCSDGRGAGCVPPRSRGRTLSCRALSQRVWTLPPGKAAARRRWQRLAPFLPAPRDAAELRAQLPGSRALTFPTARPALTFPNPAPGVGKPLRATQRDLLAGQAVRIPFRVPGQEGFCWFSVRPLDCFPWGRSHKEKALKALKC